MTITEQCAVGNNYRQITIEILPDDILLEVFDFYRLHAERVSRGGPWKWQCLAHVCRRWRYILSTSPRRLNLRIILKSRAHMKSIIDSWPEFPIVIRYRGPKSQKMKTKGVNNIIDALHYPDRICEVDLVATSSVLGSLIRLLEKSFMALKSIRIESNNTTGSPLVLPGTFLGGSAPRLYRFELDGISIPFAALRPVLLSASDLVVLDLGHIQNPGYISPEALIPVLSTLARLSRLVLRFDPPTSRLAQSTRFPPQASITLASLRRFTFRGASEYLEVLVSRMKLPALNHLSVSFFNQLIIEIPRLCLFIGLIDTLSSPTEVTVIHSHRHTSISLERRGARRSYLGDLWFHIPFKQLDWQLSFIAQIVSQLYPLLSNARSLTIQRPDLSLIYGCDSPDEGRDVDPTQWLEVFQPFNGVRSVRVDEEFVPDVVQVLGMATDDVLFPALTSLELKGYHKSASVQEAVQPIIEARRRSGREINVHG
jgi:F-box-like